MRTVVAIVATAVGAILILVGGVLAGLGGLFAVLILLGSNPAFAVVPLWILGVGIALMIVGGLTAFSRPRFPETAEPPEGWMRDAPGEGLSLPSLSRSAVARLAFAAVLVVIAVGFVSTAVTRITHADRDRLNQRSEASLYYPGSVLLESGGNESGVSHSAQIQRTLGTQASIDDVVAFYDGELIAKGWDTGGSSMTPGRDESKVCSWHTTDFTLLLTFRNLDEYPHPPSDHEFATVYDFTIFDHGSLDGYRACLPS